MTKKTSAAVAAIAARVLGDEGVITPDVQAAIGTAIDECGLPLSDRAKLVLVGKIETALAPIVEDFKTVCASCVAQSEPPKQPEGLGKPGGDEA